MDTSNGAPVIAVQPFGRGRSMAFTSDITYAWGTLHNRTWGPPETSTAPSIRQIQNSPLAAETKFNNSYFRRFWRRTVQWLAENSIRSKVAGFNATTPYLSWPHQVGLSVSAESADELAMARLSTGTCSATVQGMPRTRTRLVYDRTSKQFKGSIPRVPNLPEKAIIEVEAHELGSAQSQRASFPITIPRLDPEAAEPSAQPEILRKLTVTTNGKVFTNGSAAALWLASRAESHLRSTTVPVPRWTHPAVLASLLALLAAEWLIRRFSV
jgi:hypothetical protein